MKIETKFDLGDKLKDKVTGLTGIVMVIAKYESGCVHYGILPQEVTDKKGIPAWTWLDSSRFELVKRKAVAFASFDPKEPATAQNPSGPYPSGPSM